MKVLIGTKNPVKIEGVKQALEKYFTNLEIEGISVDSEVGDQPIDKEILVGAKNRVKNLKAYAKQNNIDVDFYIAIEGGTTNLLGDWIVINIAVIEDKKGNLSYGTSQGIPVPVRYIEEAKKSELSKVMDKVFNKNQLGKDKNETTLESILTKNELSRIDLIRDASIMALIGHINGEVWKLR
ncbi:MAG: DUF84 family protein [Clostridia bacterium]|nr:DUF84 family protein [Clostridia bacterium]